MFVFRPILAIALTLLEPPLVGALAVAVSVEPAAAQSHACGVDYYVNSRGNCVHRPVQSSSVPQGATAQCRDGSYSFSQSHSGTCSQHGGVARWL